jgi:hypothetical protein
MKKLIYFSLLVIPFLAKGQEKQIKLAEPQYTGRIVFVNGDEPVALEQQKSSTKSKAGASVYLTGIGKIKGTNNLKGVASPVRIEKSDKYQFIARVPDNNVDPFQLLNIFKLEQKIKKTEEQSYRFIETASAATFSGSSSMDIGFIEFDAVKYGEHSFLITVSQPLETAEYAMTLEGSRDLFNMFGIDE